MSEALQPFPFYGGKAKHLDFILPRLPLAGHYVEPFGGSAAVLLSREPAPVETYNDVDGDLTTFFRVLRDRPEELIAKLEATPYSREEYVEAVEAIGDDSIDEIERARLFFVRAHQVYAGLAQTATPGRWSYSRGSSNRGMSNLVSGYWTSVDGLQEVADRLLTVQVENKEAIDVVERYDSTDTLIYADPPYPPCVRAEAGRGTTTASAYGEEMTDEDHRELLEVLVEVDADVAISTYRSDLYDRALEGWTISVGDAKLLATKHDAGHDQRTEALYTNYESDDVEASEVIEA